MSSQQGSSSGQSPPGNFWQRTRARIPACSPLTCCTCARTPSAQSDSKHPTSTPISKPKPWYKFRSERTEPKDSSEQKTSLLKTTMTRTQDDLKHLRFWRAVASEFLGTMLYVLIGCGAWIQTEEKHPLTVRVALAFGLTYAIIIFCVRNVTDAHLNPSVTVAMLVTRRTCLLRGFLYIIAQFLGAILGAALLYGLTADMYQANLGCTVPTDKVSDAQGFGVEVFCTFMLVFVVFAAYEKTKREEAICAPFIIGLALAAVSLFSIPYTGGSMNTARSFGPAVIKSIWKRHWLYWFGPLLGGILGGATYDIIYSTKASLNRMRTCMLVFHRGARDQPPTDIEASDPDLARDLPEAESDIALRSTKLGEQVTEENKRNLEGEDRAAEEEDELKPK